MTEVEKKELEFLLMELTEGQLLPEQSHRLVEMIQQYPEAKKQYLEYCQVHAMLAWEHGVLGVGQSPHSLSIHEIQPKSPSTSKRLVIAALVVCGISLVAAMEGNIKMQPGKRLFP